MNYKKLIQNNKLWAEEIINKDSDYFKKLAKGQNPEILMIGCSDSRVSLEKILGANLGDLFIHRNIGNQVNITDINFLSVLDYSINILKIKHIIIMGHYDCGGVSAALNGIQHSIVENWIMPIRNLYIQNKTELMHIKDSQKRKDKLSEINVKQQALNIFKTSVMQKAIASQTAPQVHAWIFDIYSGKIKEIDFSK